MRKLYCWITVKPSQKYTFSQILGKVEYGGGVEILVRSLGQGKPYMNEDKTCVLKNNFVSGREYGQNRKFPRRAIISNKDWYIG